MSPRVTVSPDRSLVDEMLDVEATGFDPGRRVTLRVRSRILDAAWESSATFRADGDGAVDPGSQEPVGGDYEGVRPMGLFQFAREVDDVDCGPRETRIEAVVDGEVRATGTCERRLLADPVTRTGVGSEDLVGELFVPPGDGPHPGVVVLGGVEGGRPNGPTAKVLASRGYAVLALAYFGVGDLPGALADVPLAYFDRAIEWFGDHHAVRSDPIGVLGRSRGGEAALQVAARNDAVRTAVAYAPTAHRFQGIAGWFRPGDGPAWTDGDDGAPYVSLRWGPRQVLDVAWNALLGRPVTYRDAHAGGVEDADQSLLDAAAIPVEDVGGPVLVVSGGDDRFWPAAAFGASIEDRLDDDGYAHPHEHLVYDDAGHAVSVPYLPVGGRSTDPVAPRLSRALGGTPDGYARADADAWGRTLEYLDAGLRPETGPERIR